MTAQPVTSGSPGVKHSARRWWALVAIAASVLVVGLDLTVLNLALPTLATSLHASTGDLQWIADSYSLVLAALILPAGLLGDRYGRKRLLTIALLVFGAASLACAYATSAGELIAARAVLGIGAAAILPLALSVLPVLFEGPDRQRAIAAIGGANMLSFPVGPIVGGYLLDHFWWGSVFLINVPVVVIALIAVVTLMPESRSAARPSIDLAGLVVSSAGLVALTFGFIRAGQDGWSDGTALGLIGAGAVALIGILPAVERWVTGRGGQPLADLRLFRSGNFRAGTALSTLISFALFGIFFALPQYFQDVRGADALGSGLRLLPMIGGMMVGMISATRLTSPRRPGGPAVGPGPVVAAGYTVMAVAMCLGAVTSLSSSTGYVLAWVAVSGLGLGFAMPTAMGVALGALSAERSGAGSALLTALRQVGSTIGVAVLGTVISNSYSGSLAAAAAKLPAAAAASLKSGVGAGVAVAGKLGSPSLLTDVRTAFVHGMDLMLWICAGIAVGCALLALLVLRRRPAPAEASPAGASPAGVILDAADAAIAPAGDETAVAAPEGAESPT